MFVNCSNVHYWCTARVSELSMFIFRVNEVLLGMIHITVYLCKHFIDSTHTHYEFVNGITVTLTVYLSIKTIVLSKCNYHIYHIHCDFVSHIWKHVGITILLVYLFHWYYMYYYNKFYFECFLNTTVSTTNTYAGQLCILHTQHIMLYIAWGISQNIFSLCSYYSTYVCI